MGALTTVAGTVQVARMVVVVARMVVEEGLMEGVDRI